MTDTCVSGDEIDFDPFSEEFFRDPHDIYRRLRAEAPVHFNPTHGLWSLSRYADVAPGMKDFATFSSAEGITLDMVLDPEHTKPSVPMIIMMDPPDHTRMRNLVRKVFTPRAIAELEPMIREIIHTFVRQLPTGAFDMVADFSTHFPIEVISSMLGVPAEDRAWLRELHAVPLERRPGETGMRPEARQAIEEAGRYHYELILERRARPRDDMISRLIEAEVDRGDGVSTKLTDIEIAGFISLLGGAGAETVAKLIGTATVLFADHPEQWQSMRADRSKIPGAFEEVLRYDGPVQYDLRYTLRDVHLHDRTIPQGSHVLMLLASATRDENAFHNAGRFDIDRPHSGHNLGFGYGIHSCLGAALARLEGRIALDALLDVMPEFTVDRTGLRRATTTNVAGWTNVPVQIT
ncbi:cytochrome P450 [Nocardia sp. NPDC019395]|uniref:cytochrome P450 n=1 Tax=Nocardia sp. NPDC019395 TaxID=3154686 RepID=UPI0033CE5721